MFVCNTIHVVRHHVRGSALFYATVFAYEYLVYDVRLQNKS